MNAKGRCAGGPSTSATGSGTVTPAEDGADASFTTTRPPHVPRTLAQRDKLVRAVDRMVTLKPREKAVLNVIVEHCDGCGYCWLNISTLVTESGYSRRSVHLALAQLVEDGLVDVFPFKRTPAELPAYLPRRAKQGRGPSTFRLGASLRVAAGLRDLALSDWPDPALGSAEWLGCTPEIEHGDAELFAHPGFCTPDVPRSPCNLGCAKDAETAKPCTPVTGVTQDLLVRVKGSSSREDPARDPETDRLLKALGIDTKEDAVTADAANSNGRTADPGDCQVLPGELGNFAATFDAWPDTTGLDLEQACLADCQALVDAGLAAWEDDHEEPA